MYTNSAKKTSKFYNDNNDGFYITDTCNGKTTCKYNSKFSELTGYENPAEITGKKLDELIHPDDIGKFYRTKKSLSKNKPFESIEIRLIKKNRSVLYVRCSLIFTYTDDGYERIIHAFSDINDATNTNQQNDIFLSMPPILFKFHLEGKFPYYFNNSFLNILGYSREELVTLGLRYHDIIIKDDLPHVKHAIANAVNFNTISSCTFRIIDKNKVLHWIKCSFQKLNSVSGAPYFLGIANDITELKKTEKDLLNSHTIINKISYNSNCAILHLSSDSEKLSLEFANERFREMFMYPEEKINFYKNDIARLIIHKNDYEFFTTSVCQNNNGSFECRGIRNDNSIVHIRISVCKTDNIETQGFVCTIEDISYSRSLEYELDLYSEQFARLTNQVSEYIFKTDFSNDTIYNFNFFTENLQLPKKLSGMPESAITKGFVSEDFKEEFCNMYNNVKNGAHKDSCTVKFRSCNNHIIWARITLTAVYNDGQPPKKAIGKITNITDRIITEEKIMQEEKYFQRQNSDTVFFCLTNLSQSKILSFSQYTLNFKHVSEKLFYNSSFITHLTSSIHPDERKLIAEQLSPKNLWNLYLHGTGNLELQYRMKSMQQKYIWVQASLNFIKDLPSDDVIFTIDVKDLNREELSETEFIRNTKHDSITGFYTKIPFKNSVNEFFEKKTFNGSLNVLYVIDFDGFKNINNSFGYDVGNQVLLSASENIKNIYPTAILGRLYGDKFLLFADNISSYDDLNITARKICHICKDINVPAIDTTSLSVSVGVAFAPLHGLDFDTLYAKADNALYNAKRFGKNKYAIYIDSSHSENNNHTESIYNVTTGMNIDEFKKEFSAAILRENVNYRLYNGDIKNFRNINHYFSYETGDRILKEVSEILQSSLMPGEFFTRIFADNFLVLTRFEDEESSMQRLNQLCKNVTDIPEISEHKAYFSIGVLDIDNSNRHIEFEHLLDCAIIAHRNARKDEGTSVVKFSTDMTNESLKKYEIISELKQAIKCGQICTYVQPQYDLIKREYVSMEALVRWNHPIKGLLSPDKFIEICEKNGFISNIDFCVLEQMCSYLQNRIKQNLRILPIAINQSQITIHEPGYFKRITELVEKYEIPPQYIELEVTESAYVNNLSYTIEILNRLKDYGFTISMDDFGTGYSCLNLLKDLPIDILKIDRGFLTQGLTEKKPKEIIKSITNMAHNIDVRVICEGVENPQQIPFLEEIGCELAQGYLFGKPMPYSEVEDFIKKSPFQPKQP